MSSVWPYLLAPPAIVFNSLAFEANIWLLYGYATYREGKHARASFRLIRNIGIVLTPVALLGPWVALVLWGLRAADAAWLGLGVAVPALMYFSGLLVEWRPAWFYDVERDRRGLRELRHRDEKIINHAVAHWDELSGEERDRCLQTYIGYPIHYREVVFMRLLDSFPLTTDTSVTTIREGLTGERMLQWGGAHLFKHLEALFDVRSRLSSLGVFRGGLSVSPEHDDHPEARSELLLARVGDDRFVVQPL
jgi:hypothetical protein